MKSFGVVALVLVHGLGLLQAVHGGNPSQITRQSTSSFKTILHFSDVHLNISHDEQQLNSNAIEFRYGNDAPVRLLDASLQYAKQVLPHPDLFLFTGDNVPHGATPAEFVAQAVDTNIRKLEEYFPASDVLMLEATAILGNGDTLPNYHMEVTNGGNSTEANPSIQSVSGAWKNSMSKENFDLFNRRGYLKYKLDDHLFLLTLNTVIYSPRHTPNTTINADPFGQFAWLRQTLAEIRDNGDAAFVAGHIPPMVDYFGGNPQWEEQYIHTYKSIVREFAQEIRAQFFGHVHSLEFRIPRLEESEDMPPLFLSGSISPAYKNNPSFIVWKYDSRTYHVDDFTVYGSDLNEAAQTLDWRFLFEASRAYGLQGLTSDSLRGMQQRMENDPALFQRYYENIFALSPRTAKCDNAACRAKSMCSLTWWSTKKEYEACVAQRTPPAPTTTTNSRNSSNASTVVAASSPTTLAPSSPAPTSESASTSSPSVPRATTSSPAADVPKSSLASAPASDVVRTATQAANSAVSKAPSASTAPSSGGTSC